MDLKLGFNAARLQWSARAGGYDAMDPQSWPRAAEL